MYLYFYERDGQTLMTTYPSFGRAIDAAMMDFSAGTCQPASVRLHNREILDYHDLHWLYSRTWNAEYNRATGTVTARNA